MDEILQHYLNRVLPHRLYAIGAFEMALHLVSNYPEAADLECRLNGRVRIVGSSTTITNPTIEIGIIHSRVLLEFLGIKARSDTALMSTKPRKADISIERFGLSKVTVEQALLPCTNDRSAAEEAIAKSLTAANKLIAHSTELIQIDNDSIANYFTTCKAIPVLFNQYFYKKLGIAMPNSEIDRYTTDY